MTHFPFLFFFSLSKPRAVEVTCCQAAKVTTGAPVSTSSIYTTLPGTAVCAFLPSCVFVCVCVWRHAERFIPPTHPYLSAAASGAVILSWPAPGQRQERNTSQPPDDFSTHWVIGMGTKAKKKKDRKREKWLRSALIWSSLVTWRKIN